MTSLELIKSRRSVRTFDARPLEKDDLDALTNYANDCENPYGIKIEWEIKNAAEAKLSSPVIVGESFYIAGKVAPVDGCAEAFGYEFEKILLYALSRGVGSVMIAGTLDRQAFERAFGVGEGEIMPCVSPLGYTAEKMSLRETLMRKGTGADRRLPFEEIFFDSSFDAPFKESAAGALQGALAVVRLSPSAVNKQPWRVVIQNDRVHFFEKGAKSAKNGFDIHKVDLGIALCHFETAARESGLDVTFERRDPGIDPRDCEYIATYVI